MKSLSRKEFEDLVESSTVLEFDGWGVKVIRTPDGHIVKSFRVKKLFTSALFKSYAVRFAEHAIRLRDLGISTVEVQELMQCRELRRNLVIYRPLPGQTLRDALRCATNRTPILWQFERLLAELHAKGVLFRSLHFGNVIVPEGGGRLGLIDIADMRFRRRSLSPMERARNFRHMVRYTGDQELLAGYGVAQFVDDYLALSGLDEAGRGRFLAALARHAPFFSIR